MEVSYDKLLSSPIFQFLIGAEKELFTIHTALIVDHSEPLSVLISGGMAEAREGYAWLEDTDPQTFARFGQYLYTGDYEAADPNIIPSPPEIVSNAPDEFPDDSLADTLEAEDHKLWLCKKKDKGKKKRLIQRNDPVQILDMKPTNFSDLKYDAAVHNFKKDPRRNMEPCEDYTEVFLCHARLYTFADKYDIPGLKDACLYKLHKTLVGFTLYKERRQDIVELVRYTYLNTRDMIEPMEKLRFLVIQYVASVAQELVQSTQFIELLGNMGQVGRDLIPRLVEAFKQGSKGPCACVFPCDCSHY
ncbi:hypothetical protein LOZ12_003654 [Ophidiomyces ophidiicola]|uniref:Uncharacterized protein n=1 Tax=Ophidiomyces ophidiicola TaxID=1387563 RepID=A0ACB8UMV7_9EURO|nr:hypothetical protein LOZ59_006540 [Ophidiomyces ophidiicola]KAI1951497.1 hypothetical protein LOZ62_001741 [Ophidiomyces ophidiicola]KAI1972448.1 hypothetical protein LOZ56_002494 [Ophidiomyces ophidiicola]KAI2016920.1 hypothetical protein LOZ45_006458 [Ophidiomyces ophidiicola]KAI2039489.1 hypothetical protein LOZ47_002275 [Ophidiomyces ophidiicola]